MKKLFAIAALALIGCGGGETPPPKTTTDSSPTPEAKAANATPTPASDSDCAGGIVQKAPAGWVPAGTMVVTMDGETPKHLEAKDASGKSTMNTDLTSDNKASKDLMSKAICSAGALAAVAPKGKPTGAVTLALVKPTSSDPKEDVKQMCTPPSDMPADLDAFQIMRVAIAGYDESFVSGKWRKWLRDMTSELGKAPDDNAKIAIKAKHADELDAVAPSKPCWFADALRGKIPTK